MTNDDRRFMLGLARKLDDRMIHPDDATGFAERVREIAGDPTVDVAPGASPEKRAMDVLEGLVIKLTSEEYGPGPVEYLPFCTYLLVKAIERATTMPAGKDG